MQKTYLKKSAGKDSPLWLGLPGYPILGADPDISGLPKVFRSERGNKILWSTLAASASVSALVAAATYIANKRAEKKWDAERKKIHENKINALNPIDAPNYVPAPENVDKIRQIGLKDTLKLEDKAALEKSAGLVLDESWSTIVPLAASTAAAYATYHATKKDMVDERIKKLDAEILAARDKLDALYAKRMETRGIKKNESAIEKSAGMFDWGSQANAVYGAALLAALAASGYAGYEYTKHVSAAERKRKIMKELLAKNTTNIPVTLHTELAGKIPTKSEDQKRRCDNGSGGWTDAGP